MRQPAPPRATGDSTHFVHGSGAATPAAIFNFAFEPDPYSKPHCGCYHEASKPIIGYFQPTKHDSAGQTHARTTSRPRPGRNRRRNAQIHVVHVIAEAAQGADGRDANDRNQNGIFRCGGPFFGPKKLRGFAGKFADHLLPPFIGGRRQPNHTNRSADARIVSFSVRYNWGGSKSRQTFRMIFFILESTNCNRKRQALCPRPIELADRYKRKNLRSGIRSKAKSFAK